jgi:hypothetical protein
MALLQRPVNLLAYPRRSCDHSSKLYISPFSPNPPLGETATPTTTGAGGGESPPPVGCRQAAIKTERPIKITGTSAGGIFFFASRNFCHPKNLILKNSLKIIFLLNVSSQTLVQTTTVFIFPIQQSFYIVLLLIKYYLCFPVSVLFVHRFRRFLGKNMLLIREIRVICRHYRESDFVFYK